MAEIKLPPLPDPKYIWHDADEPGEAELFEFEFAGAVDGRCDICERLYSKAQMDAYARAAVEADRAARKPLTPEQLADKCEAWLQGGGASNIVDAYEAGARAAERMHGIGA